MPDETPTKTPILLWVLVILSLLGNVLLFAWKVPAINGDGTELSEYLRDSTLGPAPERRENFYLWVKNTHLRVDQLLDEAKRQGWSIPEPEHHLQPPPPPPW